MKRYTSESRLRNPADFAATLWHDFAASRELAVQIFLRDVRSLYRQSFLGLIWLFLPPLLTAGLWIFLNSQNVLGEVKSSIPYPVYVLFGTTLWAFFSTAVSGPLDAIKANEQMLAKSNFPIESIAIASLLRSVFFSTLQVIPLGIAVYAYSVQVSWTIVFLPFLIVLVSLLGFAVGWILVPLGSLYNDFRQALPFALQFLLYLSPVVYVTPKSSVWEWIAIANPMIPLITVARELTFGASVSYGVSCLVIAAVLSVAVVAIWSTVRLSLPFLVERMSG